MPTNSPSVTRFLERYRYKADVYDYWTLLDGGVGEVQGDCEDFAYTMLWLISGESWWRFWWMIVTCQAMIWAVRFPKTGEGHAALWVRGQGWIDCNYPRWSPTSHYTKMFPFIAPLFALALAIK